MKNGKRSAHQRDIKAVLAAPVLDSFVTKMAVWKVFLKERYIAGVQTWSVIAVKVDGTVIGPKDYLSPRLAKTEFERLRDQLTTYTTDIGDLNV